MPTYEYKCEACGHTFEKFQSITAAPVKKCPECGKSKVRKLISAGGGMIFKGSGFYITDYRSEGYQNAAKADSGASSDSAAPAKTEGQSEAKSDAKPTESKSESKGESKSESKPAPKVESKAPEKKSESRPAKSDSKSPKSGTKW